MKMKKYLTKKNIILFTIILVIIAVIILVVLYLMNNTIIFKDSEEVKEDMLGIESNIKNGESYKIDNPLYNKDVGVSEETLYIKQNASSKLKESVQGTDIGYEKSTKSTNGMIILEAYGGTEATEYKVISHTKDVLNIEVFGYENLCNLFYEIDSVKDKKLIEEGKDNLQKNMIASNTTYTLTADMENLVNTVFFFDSDMKFISSTTEKTFTTPENARYIKIMSETQNTNQEKKDVKYNLVLGTEGSEYFMCDSTQTSIDVNQTIMSHIPFTSEKMVVYVDGGEIELNYVSR